MKKNPLFLILGISAGFFLVFLAFVVFVLGALVNDGTKPKFSLRGGDKVGVVQLSGVIMDSTKTLKQLKRFEEDESIKGVILRINSPGGAVAPSQEIHDAVLALKKEKPVVASFESLAASGGYYVAIAANQIVTNPGTITGSIGVIMDFVNLGDLYKWAKVDRYNLKSGKFKDTGNDTRPMTPEEKELMQTLINNVYEQFARAVAQGRHMSLEKVKELADGRIYTGEQAVKFGLADKLGGMEVAIESIKSLASIKGKPQLIYPEPKRRKFLDMLVDGLSHGIVSALLGQLGLSAQDTNGDTELRSGIFGGRTLYFL